MNKAITKDDVGKSAIFHGHDNGLYHVKIISKKNNIIKIKYDAPIKGITGVVGYISDPTRLLILN